MSGAARRAEESAAGVRADQRPRRVEEPESLLVVKRCRGQHGQRVMQQIAGITDLLNTSTAIEMSRRLAWVVSQCR